MTKIEETGFPYVESHNVTLSEKMEEELFLGLRKSMGVSKNQFKKKFNKDIFEVFGAPIKDQKETGLLEENHDYIKLTHRGKLLGNEVFQAFIGII